MTSRTSASSTVPEKPLAVRRSPIFDLIMRTTSAVRVSFSLIAFVSVSFSVCSSAMDSPMTLEKARLGRRGPSPTTSCGSHDLLYAQPRVQHVTKTVAQEVQAEAGDRQGQAGEEAHPERLADHVLAAGDDVAPRRDVRRHTDAEKAQDRLGQDRVGEDEARLDQQRPHAVRQDVAERDREIAPAERSRRLDVVELAQAQHGAPNQH